MRRTVRLGLWLVILICVWQIGLTSAVSNAFLQFYAAGVVPGTQVVLTPNEMFLLMGALLVASAALIFRSEVGKLFRWMRKGSLAVKGDAAAPPDDSANIPANAPLVEPAANKPVVIIRLPRKPSALERAFTRLRPLLAPAIRATVRRLSMWTAVLVTVAILTSLRVWQWAEPRFRQFDRYLDRRLHQNETTATLLAAGGQAGRLIRDWTTQARTQFDRVFPG